MAEARRLPQPAYDKWNVLVVGGDNLVSQMFHRKGCKIVNRAFDANVVCLTGGADISPLLYGERLHKQTGPLNLTRDLNEVRLIRSLPPGMPKLGICRGGQLLNVLSGGGMYQHVDGHVGVMHRALHRTTGEIVFVSSTHHQMMKGNLYTGYEFLVAQQSSEYHGDNYCWKPEKTEQTKDDWNDVEGVYYRHTNSLCFQPHPEYSAAKETARIFWDSIEDLVDWAYFYDKLARTKKGDAA